MKAHLLSLALLAFIAQPTARPLAATSESHADLHIEQHAFEMASGEVVRYELGTIHVPENRQVPDSRKIGVGFARFPTTTTGVERPPIFTLPGGPGSSLVSRLLTEDLQQKERAIRRLAALRHIADVVLVDQRGFSQMGDVLEVELPNPPPVVGRPATVDDRVAYVTAFARSVVAKYADSEIDLRGYTVIQCAHDVDDLRRALGYDQIVLRGTSFGSQWSFMVMRLHPDGVARAILSGVEPINHGYDMPSDVFAAVRRMWTAVDASSEFAPYLPDGGMNVAARAVIERLEKKPLQVEAEDGRVVAILGPDDFPWKEPSRILELYHGELGRWAETRSDDQPEAPRTVDLIGYLIDTSLGVTRERQEQLWHDPATRYISRRNFAPGLATAPIWPTPDVGDRLRNPIQSEIPVVLAQGDWDIKTPVENTLEIAPFFTNSRVLIAERGGHGVLEPIARQLPDVWLQIEEFIASGDLDGIPSRVRLAPSTEFKKPNFVRPSP